MRDPRRRRGTAVAITAGLLTTWVLGVGALVQFVDVGAAARRERASAPEPAGMPPLPERAAVIPSTAEALRAMLMARARPRPDRRALLAVSELHRIHVGALAATTARFDTDHWTVLHGNAIVGSLPETPDFDDVLALLRTWNDALLRRRPASPTRGARVPPEALGWASLDAGRPPWVALDLVGTLWARGFHSRELLAAAARASVALAFTMRDPADAGDAVVARSLAILAWARGAGADVTDAEALLARSLGYTRAAAALAGALPAGNPVRAYLGGEAVPGFARPAPAATVDASLSALEREVGDAGTGPLLARVEALSARRDVHGPFVDRDVLAARDRAGVEADLVAHVDALPPAAAVAFAQGLEAGCPESMRDFVAWLAHDAEAAAGRLAAPLLLRDLAPGPFHAGTLLARSALRVARAVERDSPRARQAFDALAARLDTRPSHRAVLLGAAREIAHDPVLLDAVCEGLLRTSPDAEPAALHACLAARDDRDALAAIVRRAALPAAERLDAMERLAAGTGAEASTVDALWNELRMSSGAGGPARLAYARWLGAVGRDADAVAVLSGASGADPGVATALSQAQQRSGDLEGAWHTVSPFVDAGPRDAVLQAVRVLAARGQRAEAERIAQVLLARDPSPAALAMTLELQWARGRDAQVAQTLVHQGARALDEGAAAIGAAFRSVFGALPMPRATRAAVALVTAGVDPVAVARLADAVAPRSDLAFAILAPLEPADELALVDLRVRAWVALRGARGESEATAWLRAHLPVALRGAAAIAAYRWGADALQWSVVDPDLDDAAHREYVWLLRAATSVRRGRDDPHRAAIAAHFQGADANEYAVFGRYLLGGADARAVLSIAEQEPLRAQAVYYLGLRAQSEGRLSEAAGWYVLTGLVGGARDREATWAADTLARWVSGGRSLARETR